MIQIMLHTLQYVVNPPNRDELSFGDKIKRSLGVSAILVTSCLILALIGASSLSVAQKISTPTKPLTITLPRGN